MKCRYEKEENLISDYDNDIHSMSRLINSFETGECLSPALNKEHIEQIIKRFRLSFDNKQVLDLGCGHGLVSCYIGNKYKSTRITAVDFSLKRIYRCIDILKYYNIRNIYFIYDDINYYLDYLIKNNIKYNYILCFEILEHLYNQQEVIDKIKYILIPNGMLLGSVPIQPNCKNNQHISPFTTIDDVTKRLNVEYIEKSKFQLRLNESIFIYWVKK